MFQADPIQTATALPPETVPGGDVVTTMLREVPVSVRVGIAPKERRAAQRLLVTVEMVSVPPAGGYHSIADCVDYDRVFGYVRDVWPTRPHTDLLEQLVEDLLAFVFQDVKILRARVLLIKPDIYPGSARAGVERLAHRPA